MFPGKIPTTGSDSPTSKKSCMPGLLFFIKIVWNKLLSVLIKTYGIAPDLDVDTDLDDRYNLDYEKEVAREQAAIKAENEKMRKRFKPALPTKKGGGWVSFLDFDIGNKHVTKNKSYSGCGKSNLVQSIEARVLKEFVL